MAINGLNPPVFTYSNFVFIGTANENNDNKFKFRLNNPSSDINTGSIRYKYWIAQPTGSESANPTEATANISTDSFGISSFACPNLNDITVNKIYKIQIAALVASGTQTDYSWSDSVMFKKDSGLTITALTPTGAIADENPLIVTFDIAANGSTDAIVQYRVTITPTGSTELVYDSGVIVNNKYDKIIHRIYDNFYSFNTIGHIVKFDYTTNYGIVGSKTATIAAGSNPTGSLIATADEEKGIIKIGSFPADGKLFRASSKDNFHNYMYLAEVETNEYYLDRIVDDVYTYKYVLAATGTSYITPNPIEVSFENDFILDKDNQLILKFNKELSNYRQTFVSASQTTIGSQYPYVRRMAANNYKTFNVGGLITYQNENFDTLSITGTSVNSSVGSGPNLCPQEISDLVEITISVGQPIDLTNQKDIIIPWLKQLQSYHRSLRWEITATPYEETSGYLPFGGLFLRPMDKIISPRQSVSLEDINLDEVTQILLYGPPNGSSIESTTLSNSAMRFTGNLVVENSSLFHHDNQSFSDWASVIFNNNSLPEQEVQKERLFRDKVIEFLSRDTIKLFKSSTEGLILVSLKDISLSPEKQLGRQIYSFTASATEVAPVNQESLQKFGFIK